MANVRLMPPNGVGTTTVINGRTYTCAGGATLDVPDFDSFSLTASGWVHAAGSVGSTAARPANPAPRQTFHDTTLNLTIVWDGKAWRNPATGAAV
jgi:hypothetical protein